jgi:hypothetical protein
MPFCALDLRILTHDPHALKALHEFLTFQIKDRRTGDSIRVNKASEWPVLMRPPLADFQPPDDTANHADSKVKG